MSKKGRGRRTPAQRILAKENRSMVGFLVALRQETVKKQMIKNVAKLAAVSETEK